MTETKDLIIITASCGKNLELSEKFLEKSNELKISSEILDLTTLDIPLFNPRIHSKENIPLEIEELKKKLFAIERWVICAPEYNGVMPPALNNTIAWLSVQSDDFRRLFNNRTVLLATHSGGGGAHCLMAMRHQFSFLGSNVIGRTMNLNKSKPFSQEKMDDLVGRVLE